MKNKNAEQSAERKARKEARKKNVDIARAIPTLEVKPSILIVCEGKNTEPSYFKQFKLSTATIVGTGYNTDSLVDKAVGLSKQESFDQVWCVFDADPKSDNPKQLANFNKAIQKAKKLKFGVAYSNQAFEYWLILHFEDHQGGPMPRTDYDAKLNYLLKPYGLSYEGKDSKTVSAELFALLQGVDGKYKDSRQTLAISRAKRIDSQIDQSNLGKAESSTAVFKLVEELLKYI